VPHRTLKFGGEDASGDVMAKEKKAAILSQVTDRTKALALIGLVVDALYLTSLPALDSSQRIYPLLIAGFILTLIAAGIIWIELKDASKPPASAPLPTTNTRPALSSGAEGRIHLNRQHIPWADLNEKCRHHFLACGTSLQSVLSRNLVDLFRVNNVQEVKIILPCTEREAPSLQQLQAYDGIKPRPVADIQVDSAVRVCTGLVDHIRLAGWPVEEHLRRYSGIMFSNITVIDNDAFIAFYDDRGVGEENITLHFTKCDSPAGYNAVMKIFRRLWKDCVTTPYAPPVSPPPSPKKRKPL
jgi:hypothetical protein